MKSLRRNPLQDKDGKLGEAEVTRALIQMNRGVSLQYFCLLALHYMPPLLCLCGGLCVLYVASLVSAADPLTDLVCLLLHVIHHRYGKGTPESEGPSALPTPFSSRGQANPALLTLKKSNLPGLC